MRRVRCGKIQMDEDVAANNSGSGNIAVPEPALKWKDSEELLKRYKTTKTGSVVFERRFKSFKGFVGN